MQMKGDPIYFIGTFIGLIGATAIGLTLVSLVLCYPLMFAWNTYLVPAVTVLMPITWGQAFWIIIICKILSASNAGGTK
jgi:hypothetical protein